MRQQFDIKNVLIVIHEEGDGSTSSALAYGLSMAQTAGAHVMVQAGSVKLDLPSGRTSGLVRGLVAAENRRLRELVAAISDQARADSTMAGIVCDTDDDQLSFAELKSRALAQARVADITVLDADASALTVDGGLLRAILFEGGRGTIIVPKDVTAFSCDRVIVAWDGSAAASRAVGAAMPFLKAATDVEIVCYVGEKDLSRSAAGADLAAALSRHGVNAVAKELAAGRDVSERLREQAGLFRADLIVMGAFVHSPIQEWLFGGVTQAMLKSSPAPILTAR
ncbi:universal stress protein [Chelatococcus sambhunathii]|uniref:Universal stress protein n=1 Tax=Chelatococcus sambhunathii TaxID=363953 RepID=A0ABU1DGM4_9HYPH|nr:universal stress protein [Chelatococcus sambhunathii]MDR4307272.1 universal stress protein [Chelatococcus sambhunathii]